MVERKAGDTSGIVGIVVMGYAFVSARIKAEGARWESSLLI